MRKLDEYEPYLTTLLSLLAPQSSLTSDPSLSEILENEKKLVVVLNHAAPLSWVPAIALLTREVCKAGGGERKPRGIMDQFFFQFAPLRPLAKYISQSEEFLNFDDLVEDFEDADQADLVIFPEGSNCFFGPSDQIQQFRSPRFIEIAVRANVPILVATHAGSESWGQIAKFPPTFSAVIPFLPNWAQKGIKSKGLINVPNVPMPLEDFRMHCELYKPKLTYDQLSDDKHERKAQLEEEANEVRSFMETSLNHLRELSKRATQEKLDSV